MSVEIEKKIAVFMSDEEFDNYRQGNELISKLVEEVGRLKSNQQVEVNLKLYLDREGVQDPIQVVDNRFMSGKEQMTSKVIVEALMREDNLLKNLVTEIQSLNSKNDKLQSRIDNLPGWIKWWIK